ncbi:MAG: ATPase domain-containing protein, partial [Ignisphaera sp.]
MEFIRLPVASTDEILRILSTIVSRKSYEVMVIDSINPILDLIVKKEEQRAILLNFFYQLLNIVNGVLVVVAEIPLGKESLELGSIEFVADAIIYLKHRIEFGMLSRIMEVRKVRGAPLTVAEIPFSLNEGEGLKVYIPPKIERVLPSGQKP